MTDIMTSPPLVNSTLPQLTQCLPEQGLGEAGMNTVRPCWGKGTALADNKSILEATVEFKTLSAEAEEALAASFVPKVFAPQAIIYLQEDEADYLYFIRSGYVRLSYLMEDGSAVLCGILPPGESFGELGIFEDSTHCDMASAIGEVNVLAISLRQFRSLRVKFPEIDTAVARVVARRYRSYVEITRMLSLRTLAARLAQALLRLADGMGMRAKVGNVMFPCISSVVTQTDLGLMARGARSNINRALKAWERDKWIAIQDRSVIILNRGKLESLALQEEF